MGEDASAEKRHVSRVLKDGSQFAGGHGRPLGVRAEGQTAAQTGIHRTHVRNQLWVLSMRGRSMAWGEGVAWDHGGQWSPQGQQPQSTKA